MTTPGSELIVTTCEPCGRFWPSWREGPIVGEPCPGCGTPVKEKKPLESIPPKIAPSARIAEIEQRIIRAKYLDGEAARIRAQEMYLDEQAGFLLDENDPLRVAERALGIEP